MQTDAAGHKSEAGGMHPGSQGLRQLVSQKFAVIASLSVVTIAIITVITLAATGMLASSSGSGGAVPKKITV